MLTVGATISGWPSSFSPGRSSSPPWPAGRRPRKPTSGGGEFWRGKRSYGWKVIESSDGAGQTTDSAVTRVAVSQLCSPSGFDSDRSVIVAGELLDTC